MTLKIIIQLKIVDYLQSYLNYMYLHAIESTVQFYPRPIDSHNIIRRKIHSSSNFKIQLVIISSFLRWQYLFSATTTHI